MYTFQTNMVKSEEHSEISHIIVSQNVLHGTDGSQSLYLQR